ncbi:MAG: cytochrome c peroxidase [Planctomycetota bacterium]
MLLLALVLIGHLRCDRPVPLPEDDLPADLGTRPPPFGLHPDRLAPPADNPFTPARFALGRKLFFDPILSADRSVSCASCHQPRLGFASDEARPRGIFGQSADRNAPTLLNRALGTRQMWDGRAASLEQQALLPIQNAREMALPLDQALARLRQSGEHAALFERAFDDGVTEQNLARALATFVRRLWLGNSPVDRFLASGEYEALSTEERAGLWIWQSKGKCSECHVGDNFSDESFHNTGVGAQHGEPEPGRFAVTGDELDRGRFKTPTLRALERTSPYMHDGSLKTLEEVVAYYRRGANRNRNLDPRIAPIDLSDDDAAHLVAFLKALSRE